MSNKNKNKSGVVYSTNPDFEYEESTENVSETLPKNKQLLRVYLDTKLKAGKKLTIIEGFVGIESDLVSLEKMLKAKLGVGGSSKDGVVLIPVSYTHLDVYKRQYSPCAPEFGCSDVAAKPVISVSWSSNSFRTVR